MSQSNASILERYFEEVLNQKKIDLVPNYVSKNFTGHGTPYVGMGLMYDQSSGDKIVILSVYPGSPADGKLMVGDVILRAQDGNRTWDTFEKLRMGGLWGQGAVGTPVTVWVRRDGFETEITLQRGLVRGFEYSFDMVERATRQTSEEWPDLKVRLVHLIEAGDMVAYHLEAQGQHAQYRRSAVWSEFGFVRIQNGKITDWWSSEETLAQYKQLGFTILSPEMAMA